MSKKINTCVNWTQQTWLTIKMILDPLADEYIPWLKIKQIIMIITNSHFYKNPSIFSYFAMKMLHNFVFAVVRNSSSKQIDRIIAKWSLYQWLYLSQCQLLCQSHLLPMSYLWAQYSGQFPHREGWTNLSRQRNTWCTIYIGFMHLTVSCCWVVWCNHAFGIQ